MHKTKIEYADRHWGIVTGCGQPPEVCATRSLCWARLGHKRFGNAGWSKLYNPNFSLRFNEHLLEAPFSLRKPSTIAVAFTGDMFGPGARREWVGEVLTVVKATPQHNYLFLTKSPESLDWFNPWPENAWVGASAVDFDSLYHAVVNLTQVKAKIKWLSLEPLLANAAADMLNGEWDSWLSKIRWLVVGGQSGPGAIKPRLSWVLGIIEISNRVGVPLWIKDNLVKLYPELPRRHEQPDAAS